MNKVRIRFIAFILLLLPQSFLSAAENVQKDKGFEILKDGWELFLQKSPEETFALTDSNTPADFTVTVPHTWNAELARFGRTAPETYGCYRYIKTNL